MTDNENRENNMMKINVAGEALKVLIAYSDSIGGNEVKKIAGDAIDSALQKMKEGLEAL